MTLKKNDQGTEVRELQKNLGIEADGWFGEATEAAVRQFQLQVGIAADGIAGDNTIAALRYGKNNPKHLSHDAILGAAAALEVDSASILAVTEVESSGNGFMADGYPTVLFERHVMYKQLEKLGCDAAALAEKYPNLVNTKRGGYVGGFAEHSRLNTAIGINSQCAIESASWGMFQIMGYHWHALGYSCADDFVSHMQSSEDYQLDAFVRFIKADPALHKALKSRKWADFAKLYNGPAYKENAYDAKLAAAYARHAQSEETA